MIHKFPKDFVTLALYKLKKMDIESKKLYKLERLLDKILNLFYTCVTGQNQRSYFERDTKNPSYMFVYLQNELFIFRGANRFSTKLTNLNIFVFKKSL